MLGHDTNNLSDIFDDWVYFGAYLFLETRLLHDVIFRWRKRTDDAVLASFKMAPMQESDGLDQTELFRKTEYRCGRRIKNTNSNSWHERRQSQSIL